MGQAWVSLDDPVPVTVRATLDRDGRVIDADPRLRDLNDRAGGRIGARLAVPALLAIARLAWRLGVPVTRTVTVADGEDDLDLRVHAEAIPAPEPSSRVELTVTGWFVRSAWSPAVREDRRKEDFLRIGADWWWETDANLSLTFISVGHDRGAVDRERLLGLPLTRLFLLAEEDPGVATILSALTSNRSFDRAPARLRDTGQPVLLSAIPRRDAAGAVTGFIGAAYHLAASERERHAVVAAAARPTPFDAVTRRLALRLDRTLRKPLDRIIEGATSIHAQSGGPLRREYVDYAADIATAGRHLLELVDDLVDLQAIELPEFRVARDAIDLAEVARQAVALLRGRASAARVRIALIPADARLPATGDARRSVQVLVNLIANAVRYSPAGGTVRVCAEQRAGFASIMVSDQGKGIALADQARIFAKFERVDPSEAGGSGLGLYIARRLARAMGGDVTVDSAPGEGARFVYTLPLRSVA